MIFIYIREVAWHPIKVSHLTNSFCQSKHGYLAANSNYHYLKHLLDISVTCKFHTFYFYRQIPLLANSTGLPLPPNSIACKFLQDDFTVKVHYMQIPRQPITAKFHYLQIQLLANSHNPCRDILVEDRRQNLPHSHLTPPVQRTSANICILIVVCIEHSSVIFSCTLLELFGLVICMYILFRACLLYCIFLIRYCDIVLNFIVFFFTFFCTFVRLPHSH